MEESCGKKIGESERKLWWKVGGKKVKAKESWWKSCGRKLDGNCPKKKRK